MTPTGIFTSRIGEIAGITASLTWAIGSLVFSRAAAPAGALNLFKNCVAAALFLATVVLGGVLRGQRPFEGCEPSGAAWLAGSAFIGIAVGDTLYLRSLQILGARRCLVLTTFAPPIAGILAAFIFNESLRPLAWCGMGVTLGGVCWVLLDRTTAAEPSGRYPGSTRVGVLFGILGAACQALGVILSRQGMERMDPLEAACFRLVTAAIITLLYAVATSKLRPWLRHLAHPGVAGRLAAASASGTFLGIWLSLISYKYAEVAVATTLTSLTPIFILPILWIFLGQRIRVTAVLGALLAVGGVALLLC